MNPMQLAVDACDCPREPGKSLVAPLCSVELDLGQPQGPVFACLSPGLHCPRARRYDYGQFCLDPNRISLYREFGI